MQRSRITLGVIAGWGIVALMSPACRQSSAAPPQLLPAEAFLARGATLRFSFGRVLSGGRLATATAQFRGSGGEIDSNGVYRADTIPGSYQVIARQRATGLEDTARIIIVPAGGQSYTTRFPLGESPISEGGRWLGGGSTGLDWADVATTPGTATGRQVGAEFTDGTAILTGTWGPDQAASATVFTGRQNDECYQEVELRLRSSLAAHRATGYEINFKASQSSAAYLQIVRWNGRLGDFTYLSDNRGARFGVRTGDVVRATVEGNVITAYKNGTMMAQARDDVFTAGAPGIGFNLESKSPGCAGTNGEYGFTSFTASDAPPR
jgi:hypothetical protein